MNEVAMFTITGTGAPIDVKCGFHPGKVEIANITSANLEKLEWWRGMAAASGFKTKDSTRSKITTLGVSEYGGYGTGLQKGFTIGADTDVNVAGEIMVVLATRGGPGNQY